VEDLILYLNMIRKKLEEYGITTFPIQLIMDEITDISTINWVKNGDPKLTEEQFLKVISRALGNGDITLN